MNILAFSFVGTEHSVCLLINGRAQIQHQEQAGEGESEFFPLTAVNQCLQEANLIINDINLIAIAGRPFLSFYRELLKHCELFPRSLQEFMGDIFSWPNHKLILPLQMKALLGYEGKIVFIPYHLCLVQGAIAERIENDLTLIILSETVEGPHLSLGRVEAGKIHLIQQLPLLLALGPSLFRQFQVKSWEDFFLLASMGRPIFTKKIEDDLAGSMSFHKKVFLKKIAPEERSHWAASWIKVLNNLCQNWVSKIEAKAPARYLFIGEVFKYLDVASNLGEVFYESEAGLSAQGAAKFCRENFFEFNRNMIYENQKDFLQTQSMPH